MQSLSLSMKSCKLGSNLNTLRVLIIAPSEISIIKKKLTTYILFEHMLEILSSF